MPRFGFPAPAPDPAEDALRAEVRAFLDAELAAGAFAPQPDCWVSAPSQSFSATLGAKGWLGMTFPKDYGGAGRPPRHRHAVTEELLAVGAPVAAHWVADRQSGAQILRHGSEAQKRRILPEIAAGRRFFAIGMSEPQAGSDLAAATTKATRTNDGWRLSGRKIWSTGAGFAQSMIVLARTGPPEGRDRHAGFSQFLVDLDGPGIEIRGIRDGSGGTHFAETLFDDAPLPADALLGEEGGGWAQVVGELALERSGPERFMTVFAALSGCLEALRGRVDDASAILLGRLIARLTALRRMSRGIARRLEAGAAPETEAALVKEMGNRFEAEALEGCRELLAALPAGDRPATLAALADGGLARLPTHSLRGGTTEIMRGIIARNLGLR